MQNATGQRNKLFAFEVGWRNSGMCVCAMYDVRVSDRNGTTKMGTCLLCQDKKILKKLLSIARGFSGSINEN